MAGADAAPGTGGTRDPYRYFRIEAKELLDRLVRAVVRAEREGVAPERVAELLRDAHTLKGAARMVKLPQVAERAHRFEGLLASYQREGAARLKEGEGTALLALLDEISALCPGVAERDPAGKASALAASAPSVRVDLEEVDALVGKISEIQGHLSSLRAAAGEERASLSTLELLERDFHEIQERGQRLRLIPVTSLASALERAVRDAANEEGKEAELEVHGAGARLDSHVLTEVQAALSHVVRNAVSHGIESPSERVAKGKPARGLLRVEAFHEGDWIRFLATDDGAGIDVARVKARARELGLASAAELERMGPEESNQLVFRPGLSTATRLSGVSGRGVGLDSVWASIRALGGTARVAGSRDGETEIELRVPITISALSVLEIQSGDRVFALPLSAVRGALRIKERELLSTSEGDAVSHGNQIVPFVALPEALGQEGGGRAREWSVIVLESRGNSVAVGVDRALGSRDVVARPLPKLMPRVPWITGVALDSQGDPQLVLNPQGFAWPTRRRASRPSSHPVEALPVLVVDDSLTTRMLEQRILESAGFKVDLAESAEEGLAKARAADHAVFLVDVEMPGMDGFRFVEEVRSDPKLKEVPAILVTSLATDEHKRRGLAVGAQGYMVKGEFNEERLLAMIGSLVGRL